MKKTILRGITVCMVIGMALSLFLVGCEPAAGPEEEIEYKLAAIFPGSIQDADYNTLGYVATEAAGEENDIEIAYSEQVAVPDVERVMREYIDGGFNIIWVHGNQFNSAAFDIGEEFSDVTFIIEVDAPVDDQKPNFWYMDRNYHTGMYILGVLATKVTETGNIGYIGGLELPFTRAELNALQQALDDQESTAKLHYLYVGDLNDPVKARTTTESLIGAGCDVLISSLNLGNYGVFTAVEKAEHKVLLTTKYTDKHEHAPDHYLTTDLFDYNPPMIEIVKRVKEGEKGGFMLLEYGSEGKPRSTQFPITHVSEEINQEIMELAEKVESGEVTIIHNYDTIEVK